MWKLILFGECKARAGLISKHFVNATLLMQLRLEALDS